MLIHAINLAQPPGKVFLAVLGVVLVFLIRRFLFKLLP